MHISYLKENLVCYWQDGGWHGCVKVIKFNSRFVYYQHYENDRRQNRKKNIPIHRLSLSQFLADHRIYNCEYGSFHKDIGKIIPPPQFSS